ncbi:MAG: hypothetical protein AB7V16_12190 [Vulcanibacillus sp.]
MSKMKINFFLDFILIFVFLIIMEPLLTGITLHEWIGLGVGIGFIIHILLHWKWVVEATKRFFKKFPKKAKLNYILDLLLLIGSFFIILSSFPISKTIDFSWLGLGGYSYSWFQIHVAVSFLTLLVIAIHIGLHWQWTISAFRKIFDYNQKLSTPVKGLVIFAIVFFGIYSFIYTEFFTVLKETLSLVNPDYSEITKGRGGGKIGGRMGIHSLTSTTDSTSVIAYFWIVSFITLVVYYLDLFINKTLKSNRRKTVK